MSSRVQNHVTGRLSLRPPQAESLARLVRALEAAPEMLGKDRDVASILATLKAEFSTLEDFERDFPSLCFALAIQVDSSRTGAEEEKMIAALLNVENPEEPTEIVIHVNMLKEGWDVTNLYTIVPLRAANARTLIEQSIGRGLRLPYGKRTGVAAVDRLNIVAHDKFQEIIDEANRGDSPIRLKQVILEAPSSEDKKVSVQVLPNLLTRLELHDDLAPHVPPALAAVDAGSEVGGEQLKAQIRPVFTTEAEFKAAHVVWKVLATYEVKRDLAPTSAALLKPEIQQEILAEVEKRLRPQQGQMLQGADDRVPALDLSAVVAKTTEILVQQTIDIPRVAVVPTGEVTTGFHPFRLGALPNFQPGQREIVGQALRTSEQFTLNRESGLRENRFEDYIVKKLIDFDDID